MRNRRGWKKFFETQINGNSAQIVFEGYEDAGALVVCCLEDEEGDVSHLGSDAW